MNTYQVLINSKDAKALKEQYKRGCVCAYEVAFALVSTCDFEYNPDIVSFDDLFERLQTWVKE